MAALCLNEWTLEFGLIVAAQQTHLALASYTIAFTRQCSPARTHYYSEFYRVLITTHLPSESESCAGLVPRDGRLIWPEHHECINLLKVT